MSKPFTFTQLIPKVRFDIILVFTATTFVRFSQQKSASICRFRTSIIFDVTAVTILGEMYKLACSSLC